MTTNTERTWFNVCIYPRRYQISKISLTYLNIQMREEIWKWDVLDSPKDYRLLNSEDFISNSAAIWQKLSNIENIIICIFQVKNYLAAEEKDKDFMSILDGLPRLGQMPILSAPFISPCSVSIIWFNAFVATRSYGNWAIIGTFGLTWLRWQWRQTLIICLTRERAWIIQ
jgi:hypothetical protein